MCNYRWCCRKKYVIHNTLHFYFTLFFCSRHKSLSKIVVSTHFEFIPNHTHISSIQTQRHRHTRTHTDTWKGFFFWCPHHLCPCDRLYSFGKWQPSLMMSNSINFTNSFHWIISKIKNRMCPYEPLMIEYKRTNGCFWFSKIRKTVNDICRVLLLLSYSLSSSIFDSGILLSEWMAVCMCAMRVAAAAISFNTFRVRIGSSIGFEIRTFHSFHHLSKKASLISRTHRPTVVHSTNDVNHFFFSLSKSYLRMTNIRI